MSKPKYRYRFEYIRMGHKWKRDETGRIEIALREGKTFPCAICINCGHTVIAKADVKPKIVCPFKKQIPLDEVLGLVFCFG